MTTRDAMKLPAIQLWRKNQKCPLFAVALTHKKVDGGRNHHVRYGRSLIFGASVRPLTGKMPTLSVFPRVVAYAPRTNSRPVAQKRRVVTLTIDVFGHLQQVSLNNYIKLASEFLYLYFY